MTMLIKWYDQMEKRQNGRHKAIPDGEDNRMEKYVRPEMDIELFQAEIITASLGCGADDDELPGGIGGGSFD